MQVWRAALCDVEWPSDIQSQLVLPSEAVNDKKSAQRAFQTWSSVLQAFAIWSRLSRSNLLAAVAVVDDLLNQTAELCAAVEIWSINERRQVNLHNNYTA